MSQDFGRVRGARRARAIRNIHVASGIFDDDLSGLKTRKNVTMRNPEPTRQDWERFYSEDPAKSYDPKTPEDRAILEQRRFMFHEAHSGKGPPGDVKQKVLLERAKQRFGTTDDIKKAGYILPDGTMLKFTSNDKTPVRDIGHEAVYDLYKNDMNDPDVPIKSHTDSPVTFEQDTGAVRTHGGQRGDFMWVEMSTEKPPTKAQWDVMKREYKEILQAKGKGTISYDVNDPSGKLIEGEVVESASPNDIHVLEQKVYRLASENQASEAK